MVKFDMKVLKQIHQSVPEGVFYFDDPRDERYAGPRHNQSVLHKNTRGTDAQAFYDEYLKLVESVRAFRYKYHEMYGRELDREATDRVVRIRTT